MTYAGSIVHFNISFPLQEMVTTAVTYNPVLLGLTYTKCFWMTTKFDTTHCR